MLNRILRLEGEVRQRPDDLELWCALAEARIAADLHEGAMDALEAAQRCVNGSASDQIRLGALFQRAGILDRARRMFVEACRLEPTSAVAQGHLGACLVALGDVAAGASCLACATWLAPRDVTIRAALGKALIRLSRPDEARLHLESAIKTQPAHPEAAALLAELHLEDGDPATARQILSPASATHPEHRHVGLMLADLWEEAGRPDQAVGILRALAVHHEEDSEVLTALGRAERLAEHRASARATLTRAAALPDANSAPLVERGLLEQQAGRMDDAVDALREAVSRDPRDVHAHRVLGEALHTMGNPEAALSTLARAAIIAPEDTKVRHSIERIVRQSDPVGPGDEFGGLARTATTVRGSGVALAGDIRQFSVERLLQMLGEQQRTGVLRVVCPRAAGELHFVEGAVAGASTTSSARLGQLLVQAGLIDENTLEALVAEQRATRNPRPLGILVVERHLLTAEQVRPVLEKQVVTALAEMLSWAEGQFVFDRQAPDGLPPSLGIELEHLLEAARAERDYR